MRIALLVLAAGLALASPAHADQRTVTLRVENMYCAACPYIVRETLAAIEGAVDVSYESKIAVVTFDDARTDPSALAAAVTSVGYPARALP